MNDLILFAMGCFVSLVVASAVGLLLWAASNEPRTIEVQPRRPREPQPRPVPEPVGSLRSKRIA